MTGRGTATAAAPQEGYDGLVLQGGGSKCFFTLGFLEAAGPALAGVREVAAVSAATAMACAHVAGMHRLALDVFAERVRRNPRNFYPLRVLRGRWPTPHHEMYRGALEEILDEARFQRLRAGPPALRFLLGVGPGRSRAVAVGLAAAAVFRGRTPRWLGTRVVEVEALQRPAELVGAVLASSAFPLFTPLPRHGGSVIIDGGAAEPVPLSALRAARRPLLVLTRPRPVRPLPPGLDYVAPPAPLGLSTWEYSDEPGLRRVYEVGLRAGERFAAGHGPQRT